MKNFLRFIVLLVIYVGVFQSLKAQYVTIPDSNFRNYLLTSNYSGCFNSDKQLDTICAAMPMECCMSVNNLNISDLTGVKYFTVAELYCDYNNLTSLPPLPPMLRYLDCSFNQLPGLNKLPDSLTILVCSGNLLGSLPDLPSSLVTILCELNQLTELPKLPDSLAFLDCGQNSITKLPTLPPTLIELYCQYNSITNLPEQLPPSLTTLRCSNNQLSVLPPLPGTLWNLFCDYNSLTTLPELPASLTYLNCDGNKLIGLPALPASLQQLYCYVNEIYCLPQLDSNLNTLWATGNHIACIPNIPTNLIGGMDSSYQVCDSSNNSNNCTPNYTVTTSEAPVTKLFPNPTDGLVNILSNVFTNADLRIITANGKIIYTINGADFSSATINLSGLPPSLYVVQITSGQGVFTQKLVLE